MNLAANIITLRRSRLILIGAVLLICALIGWYVVPRWVELPAGLLRDLKPGRVYRAADGTPLRQMLNDEGLRMLPSVRFEKLPEELIHATMAAEDKRFFEHGGIDLIAVCRAAFANVVARRVTSGASTITQQLIKVASPREARTWRTKVREALQARHLEMRWSKQQIMAAYLNRVSYGNLFTGCASAAQGYFRKPLSDLTTAECAFLAALPQAPGRMNPFRSVDRVAGRQQWIIGRMKELGMIEGEAFEIARDQRIRLQRFLGGFLASHAIGLLNEDADQAGQDVVTTLDAGLQRRIESIIAHRLEGLRARHVGHAACVVIENASGRVVALVGSRDFFSDDGGQINGAWVPHSPGSALKPFTYALAFEQGRHGASIVPDLPVEYQTPTGLYRPENYDHRFYGPMTYRDALGNSLNISAVRVLQSTGGAEKLLALLQRLGLTTLTESAEHYGLGLTIGNAPVRLVELTNAYAALARGGEWRPWTLHHSMAAPPAVRVLSERACFLIADILSDNQARLITFGAHSPLRLPFRVAVKTGTSTNYRDNWAVGFTPQFTVGVWAGNFEGQPMEDVTGVTGAGPIFRDVFLMLHDQQRQTWFKDPLAVTRLRIDPRNGKLVPRGQGPPVRMSREEVFWDSVRPPMANASDYDSSTGAAILPAMYEQWAKSRDNWLGNLVMTKDGIAGEWRILSPADGLVVKLNPDLPQGNKLLLRADSAVMWSCDTLRIVDQGRQSYALLQPGSHEISAEKEDVKRTVRIRVESSK